MTPLLFALPGNESFAIELATQLGAELGKAEIRRFPDGDSYVRLDTPVSGREVILVCTLDHPDDKFLPLAFMAATARELGASHVGLVSPYLAYMRQDTRFRPGEAITSVQFGKLLGATMDWLVTVDPHLHRHHSLQDVYAIPTITVQAAPCLTSWIEHNVHMPILIGPDCESEQWVASVSGGLFPYTILAKSRRGDRDVEISAPKLGDYAGRTPVLVDDIISTGQTMLTTIRHLAALGQPAPVCLGVHAIFAGDAYLNLLANGARQIATCNTIPHQSNQIDVVAPIAASVRRMLET